MTTTNPITVRRMAFVFPKDIDPSTLFGDPERSYVIAGVSMVLPYLEPYLIRTMKEARSHINNPALIDDIERFIGQEGQHFKAHMAFNELIRKHFPGLMKLEAEVDADYRRFSSQKSTNWNLAYAEGFEALTTSIALSLVETDHDLHPDVADMLIWHLVEEIEHRTVAFDVYNHVHGSYLYRLAVGGYAQWHLLRFVRRVCAHMIQAKPEIIENAGGLTTIRRSRRPEVNQQLRAVLLGWLKSAMPWYTPHKISFTPKMQELAAGYTARATGAR